MFKKYSFLVIIFLGITSCAQNKISMYSKQNKIVPKINIPLSADKLLSKAAYEFQKNFELVTGTKLTIERSDGFNNNYSYIILRIKSVQKKNYCYSKKGKNINIEGKDYENLMYAINDFFQKFTSLTYSAKTRKDTSVVIKDEINIPNRFDFCGEPYFEYREPYFSTNFKTDFWGWHKTNYLEIDWGIWGHNLPKVLKGEDLSLNAYAKIGDKRTEEQFCFTSDSLFNFVNKKVFEIYQSDNALNKFMILPNDNPLVCNCGTCKAVGNTKTDAAPAVFTFMNRLAEKHKNLSFFTTAYMSVKNVPNFKANKNVGVFYSTIDIQKGIPLEKSKDFKDFEKAIKRWTKYVEKVYIWDYAVNFDNYFDIYPVLNVAQKNLQLYKNLGISGVFMHGSEYNYNTFQELKATVLAKLLWDTEIDINQEIETYFRERYPKKLANLLNSYYSFIDKSFAINKKELSIYSGIDKTISKYLDPKVFFSFYNDFDLNTQSNKFDNEYLKLATALTFLKLEIMRVYGFGEFGYATLNKNNEIIVKNEAALLLDKLTAYSKASKLTTYSESKYKIEEYIKDWRAKIYRNHKKKHYFFKKPFEVTSNLDEDYQKPRVLNNGAFGLKDYNTNWHIVSIDDLSLKIDKKEITGAKKIALSFLNDTKHSIYQPESIELLDEDYNLIKKINIKFNQENLAILETSIDLPTEFEKNQLPETFILRIKRNKNRGKSLLACDEIIFF